MTNNPFFSIIIPIYNGVSNGLDICLNSIWEQPIDSSMYEVICVDDCSTDNTREWLHNQAKEHSNLIVVENEHNVRQGGSRNNGFRIARGKYIALIDQDDYYHEDAFAKVYDCLKDSDLDILIVDCAYQSPGKVSNVLQHNFVHREVMTGDEIIAKNSIPYAPWKFIFKRQLVIENNLFFSENERIEDVDWVHVLTHHGKRVQYQPILFIHYNKTPSSTTMSSYKTPITTYSTLHLSQRLHGLVESTFKDSEPKVKGYISSLGDKFIWLGLRNYFFFKDNFKNKAKEIKNIKKTKNANIITKSALSFPLTFSIISNLFSPLGYILIKLYRRIKY